MPVDGKGLKPAETPQGLKPSSASAPLGELIRLKPAETLSGIETTDSCALLQLVRLKPAETLSGIETHNRPRMV